MRKRKLSKTAILIRLLTYSGLFLLLSLVLLPFLYTVSISIRSPPEIFTKDFRWVPNNPTFEPWVKALTEYKMSKYLLNSLYVALGTAALSLIISVPSAYSFARKRFFGRRVAFYVIAIAFLFPYVLLTVPIAVLWLENKLANTIHGLWLANLTFTTPFAMWILRDFFSKLPKELEEVAMVYGTTDLGAFFRVIIPLSKPVLVAVFFLGFLTGWEDFMFANVLTREETRTAVVNLYFFTTQAGFTYWGEFMAAVIMVTLPPAVLYALLQKYVVRGLALTVEA
jgi:multiple sugar transport system permease protein